MELDKLNQMYVVLIRGLKEGDIEYFLSPSEYTGLAFCHPLWPDTMEKGTCNVI